MFEKDSQSLPDLISLENCVTQYSKIHMINVIVLSMLVLNVTLIAKAPSIAPTAEKAQQEAQKL